MATLWKRAAACAAWLGERLLDLAAWCIERAQRAIERRRGYPFDHDAD